LLKSLTNSIKPGLAAILIDREFINGLFTLALPIILQNFVMASLNMVAVMMIGQLGEISVAAVGLCNQIFFLFMLLLFGINSGCAIFTAQLWGKRDVTNIRKVLGVALAMSLVSAGLFASIAFFIPTTALSVYTKDPAVISAGGNYLRLFGISFLFMPVSFAYAFILRSIGDVKTPLVVSVGALSLSTAFSYIFIFGKLHFPALGIDGAALAIVIARILECISLLALTYNKKSPAAATLNELFDFDLTFVGKVVRRVIPVALNEVFWSLGITMYYIVFAHISTNAIAAVNIAATVENLSMVFFIGTANGCAILVGNSIGADDENKAFDYAGRTLYLCMVGALFVGLSVIGLSGAILSIYKVSPEVVLYARRILTVIGICLWLRSANMVLFLGVLRSGGDTRFALILDAGTIWVVGVPLAFVGAFYFHFPVHIVYLLVMADEFTKWLIAMARFYSKKWINNLVQTI
jgi:putative MATE family efflux protein